MDDDAKAWRMSVLGVGLDLEKGFRGIQQGGKVEWECGMGPGFSKFFTGVR